MHSQLFALVMEHDPNLIFVKDERSVILYANKAFLEVYPPERRGRIIGTTTAEEFSAEEAGLWLAEDRRALARGHSEMVEDIIDWRGIKRIFLTRKIAFQTIGGEPRLLGISTDISELAARERSLVAANDRLAHFAAFAAHDLRSPLASFVSGLDMIERDKGTSLSPRSSNYLDLIRNSAHNLASHVTTLLATAKMDRSSNIERRLTDLNILVEEVRFNLSDLMQQTGTLLHAERLPALAVEPNLFRQLLQNLVENSIKHRADGPAIVVVRYERTTSGDVVAVEDNGLGVAFDDVERVFHAFAQGSGAEDGIGVGLGLCRRVIELHAGTIEIDTAFTGGCRVVITLPSGRKTDRLSAAA